MLTQVGTPRPRASVRNLGTPSCPSPVLRVPAASALRLGQGSRRRCFCDAVVPLPHASSSADAFHLSHGPLLWPQAVDFLQAVGVCAEVLGCLQKRNAPWLQLFQLTETGKKSKDTRKRMDGPRLS